MTTVLFSGAPSVGKTTLARALSNILHAFGHGVHHVEETSKRLIEIGHPATVNHYLFSATTQLDIQQKGREAEFTVIETPIFLYGLYACQVVNPREHADCTAYSELKRICDKETRSYRKPGHRVFHIHSNHLLENEIARYMDTFGLPYVRISNHDIMPRLESVLSYLDLYWWIPGIVESIGVDLERACDNAEMSVLNNNSEG